MDHNDVSERVIGCAIEVHRALGPGLLESIYEDAICHEFALAGLRFERQRRVPVRYRGVILATQLRLDLIVEDKLVVENKAKSEVTPIDKQQLLTYLRLCDVKLGLIVNFNVLKLVDGVTRVVNNLAEG